MFKLFMETDQIRVLLLFKTFAFISRVSWNQTVSKIKDADIKGAPPARIQWMSTLIHADRLLYFCTTVFHIVALVR